MIQMFGNVRLEFVEYNAKQDCEMKWASWTYDGYSVSFTMLQCNNVTILQMFIFIFLPTTIDKRFSQACADMAGGAKIFCLNILSSPC